MCETHLLGALLCEEADEGTDLVRSRVRVRVRVAAGSGFDEGADHSAAAAAPHDEDLLHLAVLLEDL